MSKKEEKDIKYWIGRTLKDEAKAQRMAGEAATAQKKLYKKAYKEINSAIDSLQLQMSAGQPVGRTQLWNYSKYLQLRDLIDKEITSTGSAQISLLDDVCKKVFEFTTDTVLDKLKPKDKAFTFLNQPNINTVLNQRWSGSSYSERVWSNTSNLAARVKESITNMIVKGSSTEDIKKALMKEFNVGYSYADRLIRTEASYTYNKASIEGYKQAGVAEVEFLAESDCCEDCAEHSGKRFNVGEEPQLPIHPNCRCCYIPVVNLDKPRE